MKKYFRFYFIFLSVVGICACHSLFTESIYYVDSVNGNDQFAGDSPHTAWKSLTRVNKHIFNSGDRLLFKAGLHYPGQLILHGSGDSIRPVRVNRYGLGSDPVLEGHGDSLFTLKLKNVSFFEIRHLKITNYGHSAMPRRTGILLEAANYGEMIHIVLDSLEVANVNGSLVKKEGGGYGIFWKNGGNQIPSRFVDLKIENCYIHNCVRNGIGSSGISDRGKWYPSKKVIIRNNLLEAIPGDGIVPIGCDSALIEYNVMRNSPDSLPVGEAAAGIWPWSSDHTLIQFNEVSGHKAKWDGQGFDSDYNCRGTIIRFNYSHDNYGGFLLVCNDGNSLGKSWNHGTLDSEISYNVSVNDGIRPYPTKRDGWFSPICHLTGPCEKITFCNNFILVPKRDDQRIQPVIIQMGNWGNAWPDSVQIKNNFILTSQTPIFNYNKELISGQPNKLLHLEEPLSPNFILKFIGKQTQNKDSVSAKNYQRLKKFMEARFRAQTKPL